MFPVLEEQIETSTTGTKSFVFDFESGDFILQNGKPVEVNGVEALKTRILKRLYTQKYKFAVYDNFGIELLKYINSSHQRSFVEIEIEREVTEALVQDPEIYSVSDFTFSKDKRTLLTSFTVHTAYGNEEVIL